MDSINNSGGAKKGKKEYRKMIAAKIEAAFFDLRSGIKEKKFRAAIKRASKLLANDLYIKADRKKKKQQSQSVEAEAIGA